MVFDLRILFSPIISQNPLRIIKLFLILKCLLPQLIAKLQIIQLYILEAIILPNKPGGRSLKDPTNFTLIIQNWGC